MGKPSFLLAFVVAALAVVVAIAVAFAIGTAWAVAVAFIIFLAANGILFLYQRHYLSAEDQADPVSETALEASGS